MKPTLNHDGVHYIIQSKNKLYVITGLPEARSEISGPNFLSKFQDIFVGFTRLKTQKMHVFLCSQILISQADQYCCHKNVTKAMLHIKQ